jgi:putative transposase
LTSDARTPSASHNQNAGKGFPATEITSLQQSRFKSPRQAQQFLSAHGPIHQHAHPRRHRMSAAEYCTYQAEAFAVWRQETCARKAA